MPINRVCYMARNIRTKVSGARYAKKQSASSSGNRHGNWAVYALWVSETDTGMPRRLLAFRLLLTLTLLSLHAYCLGAVLSAPVGGAPIALPSGQLPCGDIAGGWQVDSSGQNIRPPGDLSQIGKSITVRIALTLAACPASKDTITFVATGPVPIIDRRSVDLWLDEGHLDVRGSNQGNPTRMGNERRAW